MKFFIPASVLSVMVFYSSLLPFLHSLNLYFSATIHKNYMFLLCNGLLVFIVRNSGLIGNSDHGQEQTPQNTNRQGRGAAAAEALGAATVDDCGKVESKVEDVNGRENGSVAEGEESELLTAEMADGEKGLIFVADEEEEEEEEDDDDDGGEIGVLSTEELNQKCEEFIRKMKAEIKFGSQQLLVF